jgi:hypothetical protein
MPCPGRRQQPEHLPVIIPRVGCSRPVFRQVADVDSSLLASVTSDSRAATPQNVTRVNDEPHLAEVSEARPSDRSGECLSVFLLEGERAVHCLVDPLVVSERPAPGHWQLLDVDATRRQAYYARVDHILTTGCAAQPDERSGRRAP